MARRCQLTSEPIQLIEANGATAQLADSRAAAYIKTTQLREALLDAKTTIELAPNAAVVRKCSNCSPVATWG